VRILLLRTFLTNIGNGFIDKGAYKTIESAFPSAKIIETSGYQFFAKYNYSRNSITAMMQKLGIKEEKKTQRSVRISDFLDVDLAFFSGCVLYPDLLDMYIPALKELSSRGVPIVFLGVGGYQYNIEKRETKYTRDCLSQLNNIALISRDQSCYKTYNDLFEYSASGIDNVFFIKDWYDPPETKQAFHAYTFDKSSEPDLSNEDIVIRPSHTPFGYSMPFAPGVSALYLLYKSKTGNQKQNVFVSDILEDYLFIYANAVETHSDRVHACVPALVYGNKAKFYHRTPRMGLFNEVIDDDISSNLVKISEEKLIDEKENQISSVVEAVEKIT
jgi:hypothetical protein